MKRHVLYFLLTVVLLILTGCPDTGLLPGDSDPLISGIVQDALTGAGIPDVTVGFGDYRGLTDSAGAFSLSIPAGEMVSGIFFLCKGTDYKFQVLSGLDLTMNEDLEYRFKMDPVDGSGYPFHTVTGRIYESDGTTEIPDGSSVRIQVINSAGAQDYLHFTYSQGIDYSDTTRTFDSDCILNVIIEDGIADYAYYLQGVDLSASTTAVNLVRPEDGYSTVTVQGADGTEFFGNIRYSDTVIFNQVYGTIDGTETDVTIYNPLNREFYWGYQDLEYDVPAAGDEVWYANFTAAEVPGNTVTLPVSTIENPGAVVAADSIQYSGSQFSCTVPDPADNYLVAIMPENAPDGPFGFILATAFPVDLPSEIHGILIDSSDTWTAWRGGVLPVNLSGNIGVEELYLFFQNETHFPGLEYKMASDDPLFKDNLIP